MDVSLTGTADKILREIWTGVSNSEGDTFVQFDGAEPSGDPTESDVNNISIGNIGDYIAGRWTCIIQPQNTGTYSFKMSRDDLSRFKLKWTGDILSGNRLNFASTSTRTVSLVSGRWYYVEARWYELIGPSNLNVLFKDPVEDTWRTIQTVANELTVRKWNGYVDNAALGSALF